MDPNLIKNRVKKWCQNGPFQKTTVLRSQDRPKRERGRKMSPKGSHMVPQRPPKRAKMASKRGLEIHPTSKEGPRWLKWAPEGHFGSILDQFSDFLCSNSTSFFIDFHCVFGSIFGTFCLHFRWLPSTWVWCFRSFWAKVTKLKFLSWSSWAKVPKPSSEAKVPKLKFLSQSS